MPEISLSDEIHERLSAFRLLMNRFDDEELPFDQFVEAVMCVGMDSMVERLLSGVDSAVLVTSMQQLAARHPREVYQFLADTLDAGNIKAPMGFHPK